VPLETIASALQEPVPLLSGLAPACGLVLEQVRYEAPLNFS
jgi:hypothetical protein